MNAKEFERLLTGLQEAMKSKRPLTEEEKKFLDETLIYKLEMRARR